MGQVFTLFVSTFSTLLAIINPLEALPVFLMLLSGASVDDTRRSPAALPFTQPACCFSS